jgi:hypothetical protein
MSSGKNHAFTRTSPNKLNPSLFSYQDVFRETNNLQMLSTDHWTTEDVVVSAVQKITFKVHQPLLVVLLISMRTLQRSLPSSSY